MKLRNFLLIIVLSLFILSGCQKDKDDNEDTTPVTPPVATETIIATASGTIGTAGGNVKLSDGATVEIAAGVLTSDTKITINKIGNEVNFAADNRYCYEVKGLSKGINVNLTFPCPKNKPKRHIGVYNYNPVTMLGAIPAFVYDSINGYTKVDNYKLLKKSQALDPCEYTRWIIEWNDAIGIGNESKLIPTPFYEQVISTCWAADALMLSKSYLNNSNKEINESTISSIMKYLQLDINEGINLSIFRRLVNPFQFYSDGVSAKVEQYFLTNNLLKTIIEKLKEDKPVIIFMPNWGHAVLIVGYRSYTTSSGYDDWELVIHDSRGVYPPTDEGGMYTNRKWSWFLDTWNPANQIGILYAEKAVSSQRSLQTIMMPTSEQPQSYITFNYTKNNQKGTIYLKYDLNAEYNHIWINSAEITQDPLPSETDKLNLRLQIYNADMDNSWFDKNSIINVKIFDRDRNVTTYDKEFQGPMPSVSKIPEYFVQSIDTVEWHKNKGDKSITHYFLKISMLHPDTKVYLDGFTVFFNMQNYIPDLYKTSLEIPSTNIYINNHNFKADMLMNVTGETGAKFRVTRNIIYNESLRGLDFKVPLPAATLTAKYKYHIELSNIIIDRTNWNPNLDNPFIKKATLDIGGSKQDLNGAGPWDFTITVDNATKSIDYSLYVYPAAINTNDGTEWVSNGGLVLSGRIQTE